MIPGESVQITFTIESEDGSTIDLNDFEAIKIVVMVNKKIQFTYTKGNVDPNLDIAIDGTNANQCYFTISASQSLTFPRGLLHAQIRIEDDGVVSKGNADLDLIEQDFSA